MLHTSLLVTEHGHACDVANGDEGNAVGGHTGSGHQGEDTCLLGAAVCQRLFKPGDIGEHEGGDVAAEGCDHVGCGEGEERNDA